MAQKLEERKKDDEFADLQTRYKKMLVLVRQIASACNKLDIEREKLHAHSKIYEGHVEEFLPNFDHYRHDEDIKKALLTSQLKQIKVA